MLKEEKDPDRNEILAWELTNKDIGDLSIVGSLLNQIQNPITSVTADGAYDGEPVYRTIAEQQPQAPPEVIIPPRVTAVLSPTSDTRPSPRDRHIQMIQGKGQRGWQSFWRFFARHGLELLQSRARTQTSFLLISFGRSHGHE